VSFSPGISLTLTSPCLSHVFHSSDAAVKQILLTLNDKFSFIIEDLDDYHLVIKADEEWRVRQELEAEVSSALSPTFLRDLHVYQLEKNAY
jgi:TFIIH basal transcription factor complex TTD-A subunit